MKKYLFIASAVAIAAALATGQARLSALLAVALFCWIAWETRQRTRFRFVQGGKGSSEAGFELDAEAAQFEIASDGSCAVFMTLDGAMSMRGRSGRELWKRPAEAGILALLPLPGGGSYYALADEAVLCAADGRVLARQAFAPPPFKQSYHLALSADGAELLLHTPWFLQFMAADLSALGQRISCEETGHYMKYAALSPLGDRVFFAGAKLLEEEQSAEARWGSWKRESGLWAADWADAVDSYGNSHLRGLAFSRDGQTLALELYHERYETRFLGADGALRHRKDAAEHPVMSPDGSLLLWESQGGGVVLGELAGMQKLWARQGADKVRHKSVDAGGSSYLIEGRRLMRLKRDGSLIWEAWFLNDPYRMAASADGRSLALVRQAKAAIVTIGEA